MRRGGIVATLVLMVAGLLAFNLSPLMGSLTAKADPVSDAKALVTKYCQELNIDNQAVVCPALEKLIDQVSQYLTEEELKDFVAELQRNAESLALGLVSGEIAPEQIDELVVRNLDSLVGKIRTAICNSAYEVAYDLAKSPTVPDRYDVVDGETLHSQAYWEAFDGLQPADIPDIKDLSSLMAAVEAAQTALDQASSELASLQTPAGRQARFEQLVGSSYASNITSYNQAVARQDAINADYAAAVAAAKLTLVAGTNTAAERLAYLSTEEGLAQAKAEAKTQPLDETTKNALRTELKKNCSGLTASVCRAGVDILVNSLTNLSSAYGAIGDNQTLIALLDGIVNSIIDAELATLNGDDNTPGSVAYMQKQINDNLQAAAEALVSSELADLDSSIANYGKLISAAESAANGLIDGEIALLESSLPNLATTLASAQTALQAAKDGNIPLETAARVAAGLTAEATNQTISQAAGTAACLAAETAFDAIYNPIRDQIKTAIEDLVNDIVAEVERVKQQVTEAVDQAIAAVRQQVQTAIDQLRSEIERVQTEIEQAIAQGRQDVQDLISELEDLYNQIQDYIDEIRQAAAVISGEIADVIDQLESIADQIKEAIDYVRHNTQAALDKAAEIIDNLVHNWNTIADVIKDSVEQVADYINSGEMAADIAAILDDLKNKTDNYIAGHCALVKETLNAASVGLGDKVTNDTLRAYLEQALAYANIYVANICDPDEDGVDIPIDECPSVTGNLPNGCLDSDGDGVADDDDACPQIAGNLANGCQDTDGDGIYDELDDCPTDATNQCNAQPPINPNPGGQLVPTEPIRATTSSSSRVTSSTPLAANDNQADEATAETEAETELADDTTVTDDGDVTKDTNGEVLGAEDSKSWSVANLILAAGTALLSIIVLIGYLGKGEGEQKHGWLRAATLIPAVAAVVTFCLTEDWSLPVAVFDVWSILMVALAIVAIVLAVLAARDGGREES